VSLPSSVLARLRRRLLVGLTVPALLLGTVGVQLAAIAPSSAAVPACNSVAGDECGGGGGGGGTAYTYLVGTFPADIVIGVPVTAQYTATGNAPITFSGVLPNGLQIDSAGLVSGIPTGPTGSFAGGVGAVGAGQGAAYVSLATTVNARPAITSAASATVSTAADASVLISATGYPAPSFAVSGGVLPSGLSLSPGGLISGVPADNATGTSVVTIRASNAFGESLQNLAITVSETRPPLVGTQPSSQTVVNGASASFTATATRWTSVRWERSNAGGAWLPIPGATTTTYVHPAVKGDTGSSFRAVFAGTGGVTVSAAAVLTVHYAPTTISAASPVLVVDGAGSFVVTSDGNPASTLSGAGLPAWMSFASNGDGTATVTGSPSAADVARTFSIEVTALNSVGATTATVAVAVYSRPSVSVSGDAVVEPGDPFTFSSVATSGFPQPTTQWQVSTDGATFASIPGATGASFTGTASVADDGRRYRAVLTNAAGVATSTAATLRVGVAPEFTSATSAAFAEGVRGSLTITASGIPLPTISARGLPAWLTLTSDAAGTATLSGTPPIGGHPELILAFAATNGFGPAVGHSIALSVHRSAVFTSGSTTTFTAGEAGAFTITTAAGVPEARSISLTGTLPEGISFADNGDGTATISGTPAAGTGGLTSLGLVATTIRGVAAPAAQAFALTVNERASFTTADHGRFDAGEAASFAVATRAGYPASTTLTASALPAGLEFTDNGDGTGSIDGTPLATSAGITAVTIIASNGVETGREQTFTVTINATPVFTSGYTTTFEQGVDNEFTVRTSGGFPVATAITVSGALPAGVGFVDNGDGTATLSGRPSAASGATYPVTLSAAATGGTTPPRVQSLVLVVEELPTFTTADRLTGRSGEPVDFAVGTSAGYPAATTLSLHGSLPDGLAFADNGDGTGRITGTPLASGAGVARVSIDADNGLASSGRLELTVTIDTAPLFSAADAATFRVGEAASFAVTTSPGFPTLTAVTRAGSLPGGLRFTDNGDGTAGIAGTPVAGSGGVYPVTLTAAPVGGSATPSIQSFTLTVLEPATVSSGPSARFELGRESAFTIATVAGYPAATTVAIAGTLPAGLRFVDNGDGTATIAGTPRQSGVFAIAIVAENGSTSAPQSVRITVVAPPGIRAVGDIRAVVGVPTTVAVATTAGYPEATVVSLEGLLPAGLRFTARGDGTATITGSAAPGTLGDYPVSIRASNGIGPDAVTSSVISVAAAPIVPLPPSEPLSTESLLGVPETASVSDSIDVHGSGFAPGSVVTLGIYSTPRKLGTVVADATGGFSVRLVLPSDLTGRHTVVAAGTALDGDPLFLVSGIDIAAAPAVTPGSSSASSTGSSTVAGSRALAATGGDIGAAPWLALFLGLAGLALVRAGSRRGRERG
jgi:hypothetical protein